jgi:hypothetical protein
LDRRATGTADRALEHLSAGSFDLGVPANQAVDLVHVVREKRLLGSKELRVRQLTHQRELHASIVVSGQLPGESRRQPIQDLALVAHSSNAWGDLEQGRYNRQISRARRVVAQSRQHAIVERAATRRQLLLECNRFVCAWFSIGAQNGNDSVDLFGNRVEA